MPKKPLKHLSMDSMIQQFSKLCENFNEFRTRPQYKLRDIIMSSFAMFYFKNPSFLHFQRMLSEREGRSNIESLFHVTDFPTDNQIRNVLDKVNPILFEEFYHKIFNNLQRGKHLEQFRILNNHYLITIDGSQYFRSQKIHCSHCLTCEKQGKTEYYHQILQAALVKPHFNKVIPLPPEEIRNEDGYEKQDCERNAAKRMIPKIRNAHPKLKIIVNVDGLYGNEPFLQCLQENRMKFISVVKSANHKYLFDFIEGNEKLGCNEYHEFIEEKESRKYGTLTKIHKYRWFNGVPLNGSSEREVNFFEYTLINENGNVGFHGTWISDIPVKESNIREIVNAARARWKIENECFNTLKNKGYHLEHNFGHGENYLSMTLFTLNLLAFLMHQIVELTEPIYAKYLETSIKKEFYKKMYTGVDWIVFKSFEDLFKAILERRKYQIIFESS